MKTRTSIIVATLLLFATLSVYAAARYAIKCKHQDCNFSVNYFDPNSLAEKAVAGYCAHCKDIVTIRSGALEEMRKREEMKKRGIDVSDLPPIEKKIKPQFTVWDPKTGQVRDLYECHKCKNLFFPYDFTYCPTCKRPSLETKQVGDHYD